jgi:hypothetical protein
MARFMVRRERYIILENPYDEKLRVEKIFFVLIWGQGLGQRIIRFNII